MTGLTNIRAALAAHDGPRCGVPYRFEFYDEGDKIVSDGDCDHPAGHAGDHGPMQPQDDAPTWEELRAVLGRLRYVEAGLDALVRSTRANGACLPACSSWAGDDCDCGYIEACDSDDAGAFAEAILDGEVTFSAAVLAAGISR